MKLVAAAVLGVAAILVLANPVVATSVVYYNATHAEGSLFYPSPLVYGDEVTLAGTDRSVTALAFLMASPTSVLLSITGAIYANDGPSGEPGTQLWSATGSATVDGTTALEFVVPDVLVPDTITWVISTGSSVAGLRLYDPPTVGTSGDFFWQYDGSAWTAYTFAGIPGEATVANFAAEIDAETVGSPAIPEPLTAIGLLIGLGGAARYVRGRSRPAR